MPSRSQRPYLHNRARLAAAGFGEAEVSHVVFDFRAGPQMLVAARCAPAEAQRP